LHVRIAAGMPADIPGDLKARRLSNQNQPSAANSSRKSKLIVSIA